jgi:RNase P/RNase MRP subunit POP5
MLVALRSTPEHLWLVEFRGARGLVRTTHLAKEAAIRALIAIDSVGGERVAVTTMGTSGTIRAATRKYLARSDGRSSESRKNPYK